MPASVETPVRVDARRAPRFALAASGHWRVGPGPFFEGTTVNMSREGFLLRTPHEAPPPATRVDVVLILAVPGTATGTRLHCTGRVVRVVAAPAGGEPQFAATIDEFRIEPARRETPALTTPSLAQDRSHQGDTT
jgi:hypothetical protein